MTTQEIYKRLNVAIPTATRWAKKNDVKRGELIHGISVYDLAKNDIKRFELRRKRGWEKGLKGMRQWDKK